MYRENNKTTCRRFIQEVFNEGNLSSIPDFVSPDSVHHELGDAAMTLRRGAKWFAESVDFYRVAFPDLRFEVQDQIAENDRVVTRLRMKGTQNGRLMGIGVSGKKVDIQGIRVDRLVEGKIAETWFHWDSLGMLQQIGALPDLNRNPTIKSEPRANETAAVPILKRISPASRQIRRPPASPLRPAA